MMSMTGGKSLIFEEDPIGLDTKVTYIDQNGVEARLDRDTSYTDFLSQENSEPKNKK